MILILSIDGDTSTDHVINWLNYFQHPYCRINIYDLVTNEVFIDLLQNRLIISEVSYDLKKINAVWARKSRFYRESDHFKEISKHLGYEEAHNIATEFSTIYNAIIGLLENKKWLTHPKHCELNKLNVLRLATSLGIKIPGTYVVSSKKRLAQINQKERQITKSVYNPRPINYKNGAFSMFTNRIEDRDLQQLPEQFFPSLVQGEIKKKYEIRTFFLIDQFYSMAIFSQEQTQTEVDFRKYNWNNPNRNVPYTLPEKVEYKLFELMTAVNLNCASIDLIKGVDGNYYFLEINPQGQFGMVDFPCNYNLHKKVAHALINLDQSGSTPSKHFTILKSIY